MGKRGSENPDLLTVAQVAHYLQLNRMTVYKYIREGRIPASRIGKSYRVRREDLEAFLEASRLSPQKAARQTPRPYPERGSEGTVRVQPPPGMPLQEEAPRERAEPLPDRPTPEEITGHPLERILRGLH